MIEDNFGVNLNYYTAQNVPGDLQIETEERKLVKANDVAELKRLVFAGLLEIDEPLDIYSKHTMLHDAVVFNQQELFNFLIQQGANPMVRDANGQTPLLKAAALGRTQMVQTLVSKAKADPRHVQGGSL